MFESVCGLQRVSCACEFQLCVCSWCACVVLMCVVSVRMVRVCVVQVCGACKVQVWDARMNGAGVWWVYVLCVYGAGMWCAYV